MSRNVSFYAFEMLSTQFRNSYVISRSFFLTILIFRLLKLTFNLQLYQDRDLKK